MTSSEPEAFTREVASISRGSWRDATLGYLAMMRGMRTEAEGLLHNAWRMRRRAGDRSLAVVVAQRLALHSLGRLRGGDVVEWTRRAGAVVAERNAVCVEAEALLGLGLGWQGRLAEGMAVCEALLGQASADDACPRLGSVRTAHGWLRLIGDDVTGARATLAETRVRGPAIRLGAARGLVVDLAVTRELRGGGMDGRGGRRRQGRVIARRDRPGLVAAARALHRDNGARSAWRMGTGRRAREGVQVSERRI